MAAAELLWSRNTRDLLLLEHSTNHMPGSPVGVWGPFICLRTYADYNYCSIGVSHAPLQFWHELPAVHTDLTGKGRSLQQDCPHFGYQPQVWDSPGHLHVWPIGHKFAGGFPRPPSNQMICWNNSQNVGKHCTSDYSFFYKGYKSGPNEETQKIRSERDRNMELPGSLSVESEMSPSWRTGMFSSEEAHLSLTAQSF